MLSMEEALAANKQDIAGVVPIEWTIDHKRREDGTFEEVVHCEYTRKGSKGETNTGTVKMIQKYDPAAWRALEPYYEAWRKGQEEPVNGTSLDVCAFLTKGQIKALKEIYIRSVEDLAGMDDTAMQHIGMGARAMKTKAQAFLDANKGHAVIAEKMAEKDRQIENLTLQLSDLTKALNEMRAEMPEKRKPGRPPKQVEAAAE